MQPLFFRGIFLVGLTIGGVAFGQEKTLTFIENPKNFTHFFGLAIEHAHYNYREPDVYQSFVDEEDRRSGAHWMTLKGNLWGGSAFYSLTWKDILFIQPEVRLLYGENQYNRGQKNKILGKTKHAIPSLIFEPRLIVGGHLPSYKNITLSPYSGISYRFKSDDSEDVMTSHGRNLGFYRKSHYVYVPLGASADYALNEKCSFSLKGEYDWIVKAWHIDRSMGDPTVKFKQLNGYGLKGEFSISYLYDKVKFSLTPYVNYWNIRNSKRKYFIMPDGNRASSREPYNITWETGIKLGVAF